MTRAAALRGLVAVVIVGIAAGVLGSAMWNTAQFDAVMDSPASVQPADAQFALFACREAQLRAAVPAGTTVYIAAGPAVGMQRAAEFLSGWAYPIPDITRARYVVSPGPDGDGCDGGVGFTVTRR